MSPRRLIKVPRPKTDPSKLKSGADRIGTFIRNEFLSEDPLIRPKLKDKKKARALEPENQD